MPSVWSTAVAAITFASATASGLAATAPRLASLHVQLPDSGVASAAAGPIVVLFWRADCGPCLLELADLAALRRAARPLRVVAVGLQPASRLRPALSKLGLPDREGLSTDQDPAALLTSFGGAPPRLPLAVAFEASGQVCARHTGYLGTDQLRAWAKTCGGLHAPG